MNTDLLYGALITGSLALAVEYIKRRLPSREKQLDDAALIRKELRDEIATLKKENQEYDTRLQTKIDEYDMLRATVSDLQETIRSQAREIKDLKRGREGGNENDSHPRNHPAR